MRFVQPFFNHSAQVITDVLVRGYPFKLDIKLLNVQTPPIDHLVLGLFLEKLVQRLVIALQIDLTPCDVDGEKLDSPVHCVSFLDNRCPI